MPLAAPDLLGIARESLPLGQIRIGSSREVPGKKQRQPERLEKFRFTTPDPDTAIAVAERYGGIPAPWDQRKGYWVVDTDVAKVDVWVPPRGLAVDTNMEMWGQERPSGPVKCLRWCDGRTERRSGRPCMCPMPTDPTDPADVQRAYDERQRLAKDGRACKVRTRYNLAIPDLPGLVGVWKLITGSANAARWSADSGEVLERAREARVFLPASLEITWWPSQDGHPYPVPILRPKQSAVQLASGELPSGLNGLLQQITTTGGADGNGPRALPSGQPAPEATPQEKPPARTRTESPRASAPAAQDAAAPSEVARDIAQTIADDTANATTREEVGNYIQRAKSAGVLEIDVETREDGEITIEPLRGWLDASWRKLPAAGAPKRAAAPVPATEAGGSLFDDGDPTWGAA